MILKAENIPPSQLFFDEGKQMKVTWTQAETGQKGGMGQNLDIWLLYEGHSDLSFMHFAQRWDPFCFSGTVDDITFWITSNDHMSDKVNTISCDVMG